MRRVIIAVIVFSCMLLGPAWAGDAKKNDAALPAASEEKAESTGLTGFVEKLFGIFNFNDQKVDRKSYGEDSGKVRPAYSDHNRNTGMTDVVPSDRGYDL